jgi:hypothetical protein
MEELWARIKSVWYDIDAKQCTRLIESMQRRIEAVLAAKGMWMDY